MGIASETTLRALFEKWLGPVPATPLRITRSARTPSTQGVYVHIELFCLGKGLACFSSGTPMARGACSRRRLCARQCGLADISGSRERAAILRQA